MSLDALQALLLNAVRNLDARPAEAEPVLEQIALQLAARRALHPDGTHLLTTLGYNVRWRNWRADERQKLLCWLLGAELPKGLTAMLGPAASVERARYLYGTIQRWVRVYGARSEMGDAVARWTADLGFIVTYVKTEFDA